MDLNDLNKVWEVKKVRDDEARENVAKQSGKSRCFWYWPIYFLMSFLVLFIIFHFLVAHELI